MNFMLLTPWKRFPQYFSWYHYAENWIETLALWQESFLAILTIFIHSIWPLNFFLEILITYQFVLVMSWLWNYISFLFVDYSFSELLMMSQVIMVKVYMNCIFFFKSWLPCMYMYMHMQYNWPVTAINL